MKRKHEPTSAEGPLHFGPDYEEAVVLSDGGELVFRLIHPEDKDLLLDGLSRLSVESRFARFLSARASLSPSILAYLTEVDQHTHFALVAGERLEDGSSRGLGVARYVCEPEDPSTAEAAIAVADEAHGRGVGGMLFRRLVAAARERGVTTFTMDVLPGNEKMLRLLRAMFPDGSAELRNDGGVEVLSIRCPLPEVSPDNLNHADMGRLYQVFKHAAEELIHVVRRARDIPLPSVLKRGSQADRAASEAAAEPQT